jgi:hypothetical protein
MSSTYRIFSRAACNFVFPPAGRPRPGKVIEDEKEDEDEEEDEDEKGGREGR